MSGNSLSAWCADFFTELPNEFWRQAVPPEATAAEIAFVEDRLGLRPGSRVLDVPCGSGRHSLALAARGHHVVGVDGSVEAIEHARAAAGGADGAAVEFVLGDMLAAADLAGAGAFDAALCLGNSLGYLDEDGVAAFAGVLHAALRPGGGIVLDVGVTAESLLPGWSGEGWSMRVGDIDASSTGSYDPASSRLSTEYTFARGAQVAHGTTVYHVLTSGRLVRLVTAAGFSDVQLLADPDGTPFELGSRRLLLTARRA